jgi:hypothetical protein
MNRTIITRSIPSANSIVNVNDEIGLASYLGYTILEHLEDLAGDGIVLASRSGNIFTFADGHAINLIETTEVVDESRLDPETLALLYAYEHQPAAAA